LPKRVLITRAAEDTAPLASTLARLGYEPVVVPLLERHWRVGDVADFAVAHPRPQVVLVTSGVVADVVATAAPKAWGNALWAAVGRATQARLEQVGLPCHLVPSQHTAEAMVAAIADELGDELKGAQVLYPRADLASPTTAASLAALGARVDEVVAYTNREPPGAREALARVLPVDATPVLSGSAGRRLAAALAGADVECLGKLVAIGPSTAGACRAAGLRVHAEASPHTLQGVLIALHAVAPPDL